MHLYTSKSFTRTVVLLYKAKLMSHNCWDKNRLLRLLLVVFSCGCEASSAE